MSEPLQTPEVAPPEHLLPSAPFEFVTGVAGTGKSWMMRRRQEEFDGVVLCATTGISAVNLGEGVITLNSYLGYFDTASLRDEWTGGWLSTKLMRRVRAGLRNLVIDEVSMLDAEQLTILALAADELNERLAAMTPETEEEAEDLDGDTRLSITLTGDFCQLPPINAPFAFESGEWKRFGESTVKLEKVWRQADPAFLSALGHMRRAQARQAVEYFVSGRRFHQTIDPKHDGVTIVAKNAEVDRFNALRMGQLSAPVKSYQATRWGKERPEWKQIPDRLDLKVGALVMVLSNRRVPGDRSDPDRPFLYVNGDIGTVEQCDESLVHVRLKRNGTVVPVAYCNRDNTVPLEPGRRKELRAVYGESWEEYVTEDKKREVIGGVSYMPLRPAWATTVHKSQGLTLESCQIDFRGHFFENPGSMYVALSRCRTPEGLRLVGSPELFVRRCKMDPRVRDWV